LSTRLKDLSKDIGSQQSGYAFQDWFYDLLDYFEVRCRRPYNSAGRQIDGSATIEGTTYLIELKFTNKQSDVTDIDSFLAKIRTKADNTMGVMMSMTGYSQNAIDSATFNGTPVLLLDHSHLYLMLHGGFTFSDLVARLRRHCSQTGAPYLLATGYGEY
jgi:hypothetical protein